MKTIWDRIHTWLAAHAPAVLASLRPGAMEAEIRAAEEAMGVTLPEDVRACYRIHDGQNPEANGWRLLLWHCWAWLPLEDMVAEWRLWQSALESMGENYGEPDGPIRAHYWYPAWVPVTSGIRGDNACLDLAPAAGGRVGQVIEAIKDAHHRDLLAGSFTEWLEQFADDLEDDAYEVDEEGNLFQP
jgi:cell wall assembly regulator SMI1